MFHFPHLPPPGLCVQPGVTAHHRCRVAPFGNPGISLLDGSPWLIAVIPRPSSARSAKASTVRRSHLTCATPRAGTSRDWEFLASNVADADVPHRMPRAALYTSPRHSGNSAVIIRMSSRTTHVPPALHSARVSRSPLLHGAGPMACSTEGCCGRISITLHLSRRIPDRASAALASALGAARPNTRQMWCPMSTSGLQTRLTEELMSELITGLMSELTHRADSPG